MTLVEGSTFCISEPGGDIAHGQPHGLFVRDTRMLSRWTLAIDARTPKPLTVQQSEPYAATFIGHLPPRGGLASGSLLVLRRRYVGDGMREDITIRNTAPLPAACLVTLAAAADFADLYEVKLGQTRAGPSARAVAGTAAASAGLARIADHILQGGEPAEVREHLRALLPTSTRKASRSPLPGAFASPERQPHALQASLPLSHRSFERSPGRAANPKPAVT